MTLKEFWQEYEGTIDFIDNSGKSVDDMDYPDETKIKEIREMGTDCYGTYYIVKLDV